METFAILFWVDPKTREEYAAFLPHVRGVLTVQHELRRDLTGAVRALRDSKSVLPTSEGSVTTRLALEQQLSKARRMFNDKVEVARAAGYQITTSFSGIDVSFGS